FNKGVATLTIQHATGVTINGQPAHPKQPYKLVTDGDSDSSQPTKIQTGTVTFWMIQRKNGVGVRMRDENAEARQKFKGRFWFDPDLKYRVEAKWVPFAQAQV